MNYFTQTRLAAGLITVSCLALALLFATYRSVGAKPSFFVLGQVSAQLSIANDECKGFVSYIGHHNEGEGLYTELWLDFSIFEEDHKQDDRSIYAEYTVTYTCKKGGPYTKKSNIAKVLTAGLKNMEAKDEFFSDECMLPEDSYPHINKVEVSNVDCHY